MTGSSDQPSPQVGHVVEILLPGQRQSFAEADVLDATGSHLVIDAGQVKLTRDRLTLRWWDDSDQVWDVAASVERFDPATGEVTLRLLEAWGPAVLRRAARIVLGRAPAELVTLGGDGRVVRRVQVHCLDLSSSGCRVSGTGLLPVSGDVLMVAAETTEVRVLVDARIVYVVPSAFGSWQAGVEFLPHDAAERATLRAWRDGVAP